MLLATSAFRRGSSSAVIAASLRHQRSSCPRFLSSVSPTNNGGDGDDSDDKQPSHHEAGVADAHSADVEDAVAATIDHGADGATAHSSDASTATDDVPSPPPPSLPSSAKTTATNNNNANNNTAPEQPGWLNTINLRPSDVVNELNRHIVGQSAAKRAVAIAMRNRWRRRQLSPGLLKEVTPRNVLMIGPTGCGKTEVARRMAKLSDAPFLKVEATKFTEVGYHGRDVDQIVRDLMDVSMALTKKRQMERLREEAKLLVDDRILDILVGPSTSGTKGQRESFRNMLDEGMLESQEIQIDVPQNLGSAGGSKDGDGAVLAFGTDSSSVNPQAVADLMKRLGAMGGGGRGGRGFDGPAMEKKKMPISEAREVILEVEIEKMLEKVDLKKEAIAAAEESGIVFIDEIDKICSSRDFTSKSADASSEGVQRDLLPLVEGTTISTKYGNVDTDYMLFIASGAFHAVKPSDMLPELQGRLPIRVELNGLTEEDLYKILTEPEANVSNISCRACALPYDPNF